MDIIDYNPVKSTDNQLLNDMTNFAEDLKENNKISERRFQKSLDEKEKLAEILLCDLTCCDSSNNSLRWNNNRLILKEFNKIRKQLSLKSGVRNKLVQWLTMEEEFIIILQHLLSTGKLPDHQRSIAQHQLTESLAFYNQLKMIKESIHYQDE